MGRARIGAAWVLSFSLLLLVFFVFRVPSVSAATVNDVDSLVSESLTPEAPVSPDTNIEGAGSEEVMSANTDSENSDPENPDPENPDPENPGPENPDPENPDPENPDPENPDPENPDEPAPKQGLLEENGFIYYYKEDGTPFTGGYKEVAVDGIVRRYFFQEDGTAFTGGYKPFDLNGKRVYYYFQEDGTAYTGGYLAFQVNGEQYYFYFQEDGSAFTGGYKEITLDGRLCYFYFLANGQGFKTGYKTVMINGKKHYFYFGSDGQALTDVLKEIPLGKRTAYMLFGTDGKAFTNGYKELSGGASTDYYYFLQNGQAFTTGYKTVKIDGTTYYFFFEENGKAFTGGLKAVPFGNQNYYYFFQNNGKARVSDWGTQGTSRYYFQANGRAAKGWFCVGNGYYYADNTCAVSTNTVVEGYRLDANGKSSTKYRINEYVKQHTNNSMTDQQKIDALYNWVLNNSMVYIRSYEHVKADWKWENGWVDDFAARQMDKWGGNCYSYAAFTGMLIREATGLEVKVYQGQTPSASGGLTYHGWTSVKQNGTWYVYDVELQKHSGFASYLCYKVPAQSSYTHLNGEGFNLY